MWLEASRLYSKQNKENAKAVLARGVSQVRRCLWGADVCREGQGGMAPSL